MRTAQECINQVVEMITTEGVEAAKAYATNTTIIIEKDGKSRATTVFQLMKDNAQEREKELEPTLPP